MPYQDNSFNIVISSCILLHIPNYQQHISETARIAKDYIIAHRTPICRQKSTSFSTFNAYDVELIEIRFNENEFISEFQKNGFSLKYHGIIFENEQIDKYVITYVFKKNRKNNNAIFSSKVNDLMTKSIEK